MGYRHLDDCYKRATEVPPLLEIAIPAKKSCWTDTKLTQIGIPRQKANDQVLVQEARHPSLLSLYESIAFCGLLVLDFGDASAALL